MIPDNGDDLRQGFTLQRQPSLTYLLDFEAGRVTGKADEKDALKQAVFLALNTERFTYEIFTPNYGNELNTLMGTSPPLAYAQMEQAITEALSADDRITGVSGFSFARNQGAVSVTFMVSSIYGEIEEKWEVKA